MKKFTTITTNIDLTNVYSAKMQNIIDHMIDGNKFIDEHTGKESECIGLAILANGCVCPLFNSRAHSMNVIRVNKKDNIAHLSMMSVGGVRYAAESMEESIEKYNKSVEMFAADEQVVAYTVF